eukprot:TRINITY_DN2162_c0_g1_i12.p1 TRINITY_DN2162_c0_g1~~TRINITY_DN2162_c0_g1_i12.p1  ORF type:complete len:635 (-),score=73.90 TRINITY_DN2162_c0_g1_i12:103-2007(-)
MNLKGTLVEREAASLLALKIKAPEGKTPKGIARPVSAQRRTDETILRVRANTPKYRGAMTGSSDVHGLTLNSPRFTSFRGLSPKAFFSISTSNSKARCISNGKSRIENNVSQSQTANSKDKSIKENIKAEEPVREQSLPKKTVSSACFRTMDNRPSSTKAHGSLSTGKLFGDQVKKENISVQFLSVKSQKTLITKKSSRPDSLSSRTDQTQKKVKQPPKLQISIGLGEILAVEEPVEKRRRKGGSSTEVLRNISNLPLPTPSKASRGTPKVALDQFITKLDKGSSFLTNILNESTASIKMGKKARPPTTGFLQSKTTKNTPSQSSQDIFVSAIQAHELTEIKLQPETQTKSQNKHKETLSEEPCIEETGYYMTCLEKYNRQANLEGEYFCQLYREHFLQSFQALSFCRMLPPVAQWVLQSKKVVLPQLPGFEQRKTIVFDLDETLIHCNESKELPSDVILPIAFPSGEIVDAGINIRPFAIEMLKELSTLFEIIVFTASHGCYANVVLDYLDPAREIIHHRLFRETCVQTDEGIFVKDLRVIANRDLKNMCLVDNAAYSFAYQLDNGIPIVPFYDNHDDKELLHLTNYLKSLLLVEDVREVNRKAFKMSAFQETDSTEELYAQLFPKGINPTHN